MAGVKECFILNECRWLPASAKLSVSVKSVHFVMSVSVCEFRFVCEYQTVCEFRFVCECQTICEFCLVSLSPKTLIYIDIRACSLFIYLSILIFSGGGECIRSLYHF